MYALIIWSTGETRVVPRLNVIDEVGEAVGKGGEVGVAVGKGSGLGQTGKVAEGVVVGAIAICVPRTPLSSVF